MDCARTVFESSIPITSQTMANCRHGSGNIKRHCRTEGEGTPIFYGTRLETRRLVSARNSGFGQKLCPEIRKLGSPPASPSSSAGPARLSRAETIAVPGKQPASQHGACRQLAPRDRAWPVPAGARECSSRGGQPVCVDQCHAADLAQEVAVSRCRRG